MAKRQITLTFEIDEDVARQMERIGLLDNPERLYISYLEQDGFLREQANFIRQLAHELGNSVVPAHGYTYILHQGMAGELNEMQRQFLEIVLQNLEQIKKLLRQ